MKILRKKKEEEEHTPCEVEHTSCEVQSNEYKVPDATGEAEHTSCEVEHTPCEVQSNEYKVPGATGEAEHTSCEVKSTKYEVPDATGEVPGEDGITEGFIREARAFAEGKGLSPEEFDEAMTQLKQIRSSSTPVSVKMLEMMLKAINYDHDVAQAMEQGEIKGRNTKIEECLMQPEQSDGLPHIKGSNIGSRTHSTSIFDLARCAK